MKTLLVTQADLRRLVHEVGIDVLMDRVIESLKTAFRTFDLARTELRQREGFTLRNARTGVLEWMPVMRQGESITIKVVGYNPMNPRHYGVPTIIATNSVYDCATGHLTALVDGVLATALRTGAASAIASRHLAHPESRVVGLVGAGAQAVTQLHALSRLFSIERVLVFDVDPVAQRSFAGRAAFLGLDVRAAPLETVEAEADIVCTVTSVGVGEGPVLEDGRLKPWVHVNAVGSDLPGKLELPRSLLERSLVCPDFLPQALVEGECQQLRPEQIGPGIIEVVQHPERFGEWRERSTVFDSTGFSLEDEAVTGVLIELARRHGLGLDVELECLAGDAMNPYDLLLPEPQGQPGQGAPEGPRPTIRVA
ncbi:ornithine cyclodeaminase family protein [Myxococcus sp. AS-1-15]|uniref:ornithine cyclodeaminase family protein n=1 Tax=Myxococcus sp. AS-1-15 TaxID=2874600 RepID=UPI001CC01659